MTTTELIPYITLAADFGLHLYDRRRERPHRLEVTAKTAISAEGRVEAEATVEHRRRSPRSDTP